MFGVDDLVGGVLNAGASTDAAEKQAAAHRDALAMQERMYNQRRADHQPWRDAGVSALSDMGGADFRRDFTNADFVKDPGYDFRMSEGQKALERSAAARGGLQSGGTLKALAQYGQNFASNEFQNAYNRFNADRDRRFNRLSGLAGMGQNAANAMSGAAADYGNNYAAGTVGIGDAEAAGILGKAAGWGQFAKGIGNLAGDLVTMGKMGSGMPGGSGGGGGGSYPDGGSVGLMGRNNGNAATWMGMQSGPRDFSFLGGKK